MEERRDGEERSREEGEERLRILESHVLFLQTPEGEPGYQPIPYQQVERRGGEGRGGEEGRSHGMGQDS